MKMLGRLILILMVMAGSGLAHASKKDVSSGVLLSFEELRAMDNESRDAYLRLVATEFAEMTGVESSASFWSLLLPQAHANQNSCIGGGIPADSSGRCLFSSYAGYTCSQGHICNPLLFGVRPDNTPFCYTDASDGPTLTRHCYDRIIVGRDSRTDLVFRTPAAATQYAEFQRQVDGLCAGGGSGAIGDSCRRVRRQTEVNRDRHRRGVEGVAGTATAAETAAATEPAPAAADEAPQVPAGANDCQSPALVSRIPARPASARGASSLQSSWGNGGGAQRDARILSEIRTGNIPPHLRNLAPVTFPVRGTCQGQANPTITICVMPDYLSVGSAQDNVHTPLGLPAAIEAAAAMGFYLPTTRMVDRIAQVASVRLSPSTRTPNASMTTTSVFYDHSREIRRTYDGSRLGAGHKKDLVVTNRMTSSQGVPIYGWHQRNGRPIQPLYLGHGPNYADYSHGIRLVSQTAFVNGRAVPLRTLLENSSCAPALSSEGSLDSRVLRRFTRGTADAAGGGSDGLAPARSPSPEPRPAQRGNR